jgi:hypothetical protein
LWRFSELRVSGGGPSAGRRALEGNDDANSNEAYESKAHESKANETGANETGANETRMVR